MTNVLVTTAKSGEVIRSYAESVKGKDRISVFPESGLTMLEQAEFVSKYGHLYNEIVTLSPFIVSEAETGCLTILDASEDDDHFRHGTSITTISMNLWTHKTIGHNAESKLNEARSKGRNSSTIGDINQSIKDCFKVGESIERSFIVQELTGCKRKINSN